MLSWAQQRRIFFIGGVLLFLLVVFGIYGLFAFYNAPDCRNGSRDGDERGVDCGGSCLRVCRADTVPLIVHFTRTFEVSRGVWGAVASGENRNTGAGARNVPYVFKLYDAENLLLYERHGMAFIPPRKVFAIFEGQMQSGSRTPTRATFEFEAEPEFVRMSEPALSVVTKGFTADERGSFLEATLSNLSRVPIEGIELTALLYGRDGNVIGASATTVKTLAGEAQSVLTFTWPSKLPLPARTEVLYAVPGRL